MCALRHRNCLKQRRCDLGRTNLLAPRGGGATRNGAPLQVRDDGRLAGARILAGKRSFVAALGPDAARARAVWVNSMAYRLALVAAGAFEGAVSLYGTNDWDIAAGALIVEQAGGIMTDAEGAPFRFNRPATRQASMLAAGPRLHARLLANLGAARAPDLAT